MKQQQDPLLQMVGFFADRLTDKQTIAIVVTLWWTAVLLS